ncbi:MAG TPA: isocitrate lyase/phosphoenolpyruvate mutase family protein [Thermoanaerobaculia bacterium]|nr:isocitrate lyase/phosphoenolpyruvate mutase family protein [Thermoanaerobaculia bacterium]
MSNQASRLRALFARPGVIRLMGAHNALGAKMAERAGFDGVWSSSFELSASYGVPDAGLVTMTEQLAAAQSMSCAVSIPVVADCDTGYGDANNVVYMVRRFETAGIAAVCIEDKEFPKRNSFLPGAQELTAIPEFQEKIRAAKRTQRHPDFLVIARVEALIAGCGTAEALRRARAYAEAGADAVLVHSKEATLGELAEVARLWDQRAPLVAVPTTYAGVTVAELEALGIKMVIYANQGLRSALRAMEETYAEILRTGSTASVEGRIWPMEAVFEVQGALELRERGGPRELGRNGRDRKVPLGMSPGLLEPKA